MLNTTALHPDYFLLMGVPGLEESHLLLSIPFSIMYILALTGNSMLIFIIGTHETLQQPMYLFLMMLAACDLLLSSTTVPKTLCIFWFNSYTISFTGCIAQTFSIHFNFAMESAILVSMAYDRYYAICHPLLYITTLTGSFIRKMVILALLRNICMITPFVFLLHRLPYEGSIVIEHTYCEHMSMARLATDDILVNVVYGLVIATCSTGVDLILIIISYVVIVRTVLTLRSSDARVKAFNTCVSHVCVITLFYIPAFFSFIAHRVGHKNISAQFHILFANLYVIVPPMMNPIIYGVKTREIRQRVVSTFCR
ncbi:olfactory receptor 52Z1P-like [Hyla sarda]|uniref:olfactory receptor 52Z1P-like n=1 Tax=Hyla sarda TaxID=327740 RepID=UPI0024C21BD2|nr:olfactory receptor 52Z1P-like [Hyla sarda]XP_056416219.1 olfactory receptor 52Z1P-like [Hyla sarda]